LDQAGIGIVATYGVRTLADYLPAGKLVDPAFFDRLLELETAVSALAPYKPVARYNHVLGRKPGTKQ
jgi:hypothetical protein